MEYKLKLISFIVSMKLKCNGDQFVGLSHIAVEREKQFKIYNMVIYSFSIFGNWDSI
jgi:hypothetical protein